MDGPTDQEPGNVAKPGPDDNAGKRENDAGGLREIDPGSAENAVKRGRGRPPKSGAETGPAKKRDYAAENARRRAKAGGTQPNAQASAKNTVHLKNEPVNVAGLESILYSLHAFAAVIVPEFGLDRPEAHTLAVAVADVNAHYATRLDPKLIAWIQLATISAGLYGPRVAAFALRKRYEKRNVPSMPRPTQAATATPDNRPSPAPAEKPASMSSNLAGAYADPTLVPDIGGDSE